METQLRMEKMKNDLHGSKTDSGEWHCVYLCSPKYRPSLKHDAESKLQNWSPCITLVQMKHPVQRVC